VSIDQTLQLPGITIPSFTVRRAETTVELGSGGSLVLAGLIESQAIRSMNEVPGVNKVPIIGDLISSESFQRNESELIVMMTAYTVQPFAQNDNTIDLRQNKSPAHEDMQAPSNAPINTHLQRRLVQALQQKGAGDASQHDMNNVRYILE
jgi:Flp pilus assembly secretin CpaC